MIIMQYENVLVGYRYYYLYNILQQIVTLCIQMTKICDVFARDGSDRFLASNSLRGRAPTSTLWKKSLFDHLRVSAFYFMIIILLSFFLFFFHFVCCTFVQFTSKQYHAIYYYPILTTFHIKTFSKLCYSRIFIICCCLRC